MYSSPNGPLCSRCNQQFQSRIHQHNYRPQTFIFRGKPPFYGIEIEVDGFPTVHTQHTKTIIETFSPKEELFYIKRDGSLQNGFELVFHPRDVSSWVELSPQLEPIMAHLVKIGGKASSIDTCGFHVHRSKNDLTRLTQTKLWILLKWCKDQLVLASRRINSRHASWTPIDNSFGRMPLSQKSMHRLLKKYGWRSVKHNIHKEVRYQCINFGSNRDTIEFRMYKGSIFTPTILGYIGLSHYLVEFAKDTLLSDICQPGTWDRFTNYLFTKRNRWKKSHYPLIEETLSLLTQCTVGHPHFKNPITEWKEV